MTFNPAEGASVGRAAHKSLILEGMAHPPAPHTGVEGQRHEPDRFCFLERHVSRPQRRAPDVYLVDHPGVFLSPETHTARRPLRLTPAHLIPTQPAWLDFRGGQRTVQNL